MEGKQGTHAKRNAMEGNARKIKRKVRKGGKGRKAADTKGKERK